MIGVFNPRNAIGPFRFHETILRFGEPGFVGMYEGIKQAADPNVDCMVVFGDLLDSSTACFEVFFFC